MQLFKTIYTRDELFLFYKELDQIIDLIFRIDGNIEKKISKVVNPEKKDLLVSFLNSSCKNLKNPVMIQETLITLKKLGNTLPVISLHLAFEPTQEILEKMSLWCESKLEQKVLFDVSLDRRLIGGAYISYNGLYLEDSVRLKIEDFFSKNHHFSRS